MTFLFFLQWLVEELGCRESVAVLDLLERPHFHPLRLKPLWWASVSEPDSPARSAWILDLHLACILWSANAARADLTSHAFSAPQCEAGSIISLQHRHHGMSITLCMAWLILAFEGKLFIGAQKITSSVSAHLLLLFCRLTSIDMNGLSMCHLSLFTFPSGW